MSKFFKAQRLVRTSVIPLDPNFKCPACGRAEKNVVLFCSTCWPLILPTDQADLRRMTIAKQDTKSKIAKCVAYVREKRKIVDLEKGLAMAVVDLKPDPVSAQMVKLREQSLKDISDALRIPFSDGGTIS